MRHTFTQPGSYKVKVRVQVVAPDDPADSTAVAVTLESKEKTVVSDGTYEPWMELASQARARNLLVGLGATANASSRDGGPATDAIDGVESTHWVCASTDGAPTISVQLARPVKASALVLGQAQNTLALKDEFDRITRVSVRLNKDKEGAELELEADPLRPTTFKFPKQVLVSRFEIRILAREKGKQAGKAGFSELALER
ncbi:MAG: discoidin domain-containing protein [Planctomycetes bacterium]|nr:discoidin domain-containing protein [Planctomycetota bacterium]